MNVQKTIVANVLNSRTNVQESRDLDISFNSSISNIDRLPESDYFDKPYRTACDE